MRIDFTKMHGTGNDFIVFDAPGGSVPPADLLRRLADRHTGIGFDQALMLQPPRHAESVVYYRIFNADGGEVEQCGNGARCIAALLFRRGRGPGGRMTLESAAGCIEARRLDDGAVSVDMGVPRFQPRDVPFDAREPAGTYSLDVAGETLEIGVVAVGNPHAVINVGDIEAAPVGRLGPAIESHPRFPRRANAGFVQFIDRSHILLRVHERGVGETLACGTGACAAVAVGRRRGALDSSVHVRVRGGELRVNWDGPGAHIWLTGPAEVSFEGHVEV
ncbi:MAG TPA: diaminopimelate epimerase [Steroidobacteraceae bacterium]